MHKECEYFLDGWETVKIRSKWRDQTEFKQSRTGVRNNWKLNHDFKHLQCINTTASNELGYDSLLYLSM